MQNRFSLHLQGDKTALFTYSRIPCQSGRLVPLCYQLQQQASINKPDCTLLRHQVKEPTRTRPFRYEQTTFQSGGHQFGTFKRQWDFTYVLMKGKDQILGEIALLFSTYNLRRTVSILGFSVFLKRLKDAFLTIFDNILLTRLWSVSTNADSLDGTTHSTFIFNIPSAATV